MQGRKSCCEFQGVYHLEFHGTEFEGSKNSVGTPGTKKTACSPGKIHENFLGNTINMVNCFIPGTLNNHFLLDGNGDFQPFPM